MGMMNNKYFVIGLCLAVFLGIAALVLGCVALFGGVPLEEDGEQEALDLPLVHTEWLLVEMDGERKPSFRSDSTAFTLLLLRDSVNRLAGKGACNRFFGDYDASEDTLSLRVSGAMQMFCPGLNDEQRYLRMLEDVRSYLIDADTLYLYDKNDLEKAVFAGRPPVVINNKE